VVYFTRRRDESGGRLNFTKFETTKIQNCISFLKTLFSGSKDDEDRIICATGGGAHKYYDLLRRELGIKVHKEDEMECLITGESMVLMAVNVWRNSSVCRYQFFH
jgi:pantothenate kinase